MKELNINELDKVSGGEYDTEAQYLSTEVIRGGNLLNPSNLREVVGQLSPGQKVEINPGFKYCIDGMVLVAIKVNGVDYMTEQDNIALKI